MKMSKRFYYMDLYTGELLTLAEMLDRAETDYDFDDWTNAVELTEYFELTAIPVAA